jgi:hypothetical protein
MIDKNFANFLFSQHWYLAVLEMLIRFVSPENLHPSPAKNLPAIPSDPARPDASEAIDYYPHQLFPHHWGVIKKPYRPAADRRPHWITIQAKGKDIKIQATELDRLYASREEAVGVRFDSLTSYVMIDIDIRSLCHPSVNRSEWDRLLQVLKGYGFLNPITLLSSNSGGMHIYFWFSNGDRLKTFHVAQLLWSICHVHGFDIKQGNLELFPNCKKFGSMYNGHRLPLQINSGSVLVDGEDLTERWDLTNSWQEFCRRVANSQQDMALLRKKLSWGVGYQSKHAPYGGGENMGTSAAEWLQNLLDRLELGWTGKGQTNELIRTACVREWVFVSDGERNDGAVLDRLINMPGYREHCGHQDEIADRVRQWMDCVISYYWPYSRQDMRQGRPILKPDALLDLDQPPVVPPSAKSTKRTDEVLARLRQIVAALLDQPLPHRIDDLILVIQEKARELKVKVFSRGTLYSSKYREEWRILVEVAKNQFKRDSYRNLPEVKAPIDISPNPEPQKILPKLTLMKVGVLLRIQIINFLSDISSVLESVSDLLVQESQNLDSETDSSIETDELIGFTYDQSIPGARSEAISKSNESTNAQSLSEIQQFAEPLTGEFLESGLDPRSPADSQTSVFSAESSEEFRERSSSGAAPEKFLGSCIPEPESQQVDRERSAMGHGDFDLEDDPEEEVPVIGSYLRRLPFSSGGKIYPELIAKVVGLIQSGAGAWRLVCAEGGQWLCPTNMVGETWVIYHPG